MKERIKILQITGNLGIGGLERVVVNLCKHLNKDLFDVSVVCLNFLGAFADELENEGIKVYLTPKKKKIDYFLFWGLKDIIGKVKPDIVHTHNTNAFIDGAIASILSKVPVKIHTDHARVFPDKKRYMIIERILSYFIDQIIAVSHETKENLIKFEHIDQKMITVIKNGIDGTKYKKKIDIGYKIKKLKLDQFKHIIGLGVRLTEQKGISYLIKAAPIILQNYPQTAFVIAGKGPLKDQLETEVSNLNLQTNFFFLGPRLDMYEILQVLDIYVLPSEWEGLPLVILEAMAAKKAIIATNIGGNSMAIENGKSGYLIPPKNPSILAEKICELLESPEKIKIFGENAYTKFVNEFSIEFMIQEHEKIYLKIMAEKNIN